MTNDKEEQTKRMISEEYKNRATGCLTTIVVVVLALLGIGTIACLLAI